MQAFSATRHNSTHPEVIEIQDDSSPLAIQRVQQLLHGKNRPTAIICAGAELTLNLLTTAMSEGLKVPREMSIIGRDYRPFLHACEPRVSAYECNHNNFRKRLTASVVELATSGRVAITSTLVVPELREGESVSSI